MTSIKKYNNNIILADDNGRQVIALGKGLGFQAAHGAEVDESLIEKVFVPKETAVINRFADTLSDLAYEYVLLASKIADYGKETLQTKLNPSIVVALADHLSVALTQADNRPEQTLIKLDVQYIHPKEFQAGVHALEIIKRERNIELPEAEAVSIALHFINAELESPSMPTAFKIVIITGGIIKTIEQHYNAELNKETLPFMRFSNHIRNMIIEYLTIPNRKDAATVAAKGAPDEDSELYEMLMKRDKGVAECCERIRLYLLETHGITIHKTDLSFLAMHITKILGARQDA